MPWTSRPGANSRAREWAAGPGAVGADLRARGARGGNWGGGGGGGGGGAVGSDLRARVSRGEKASMVPIMLGGWKKVQGSGAGAGPGPAGRNERALHAGSRAGWAFAARRRGADGGGGGLRCRCLPAGPATPGPV